MWQNSGYPRHVGEADGVTVVQHFSFQAEHGYDGQDERRGGLLSQCHVLHAGWDHARESMLLFGPSLKDLGELMLMQRLQHPLSWMVAPRTFSPYPMHGWEEKLRF